MLCSDTTKSTASSGRPSVSQRFRHWVKGQATVAALGEDLGLSLFPSLYASSGGLTEAYIATRKASRGGRAANGKRKGLWLKVLRLWHLSLVTLAHYALGVEVSEAPFLRRKTEQIARRIQQLEQPGFTVHKSDPLLDEESSEPAELSSSSAQSPANRSRSPRRDTPEFRASGFLSSGRVIPPEPPVARSRRSTVSGLSASSASSSLVSRPRPSSSVVPSVSAPRPEPPIAAQRALPVLHRR